jgi:hypothetical protein
MPRWNVINFTGLILSVRLLTVCSFLARASFVHQNLVLSALEQLVSFCRQYAEQYRGTKSSGDGNSEASMARHPALLRSVHSASSMAAGGFHEGPASLLPRPSSMASGLLSTDDTIAQHQVSMASGKY